MRWACYLGILLRQFVGGDGVGYRSAFPPISHVCGKIGGDFEGDLWIRIR